MMRDWHWEGRKETEWIKVQRNLKCGGREVEGANMEGLCLLRLSLGK